MCAPQFSREFGVPNVGDVRGDGYVFRGMKRSSKNGKLYEHWLSPTSMEKARRFWNKSAEKRKQLRLDDPEFRLRDNQKIVGRQREWFAADPRRVMVQSARHRAKKAGVPCTIGVDDFTIPECCPVLGIRLQRAEGQRGGMNYASPSLDRIRPERGYVPGNVVVVSMRANLIKNNASMDELRQIADFYSALSSD